MLKSSNTETVQFIQGTGSRCIAEVGILYGDTSEQIARYLDGEGELHLFDFEDYINEVVNRLRLKGYHNVVGHGNSRKRLDSYNWSLMRLLQRHEEPIFDYVFLDGSHIWGIDALAFVLIDRLLRKGGYIDFDDYDWSLAKSPTQNVAVQKATAERFTEEQIEEQHVRLIVDILVKRDPQYEEVIPNKIFRKVG